MTRIVDLPAVSSVVATDVFYDAATGTIDKKATAAQIKAFTNTNSSNAAFTQGSIIFAGASGVLSEDNTNLVWDSTNHRWGINNGAPEFAIHAGPSSAVMGSFFSIWGFPVATYEFNKIETSSVIFPSMVQQVWEFTDAQNTISGGGSAAAGDVTTVEWTRDSSKFGQNEMFAKVGVIVIDGTGRNDKGHAFAIGGQIFPTVTIKFGDAVDALIQTAGGITYPLLVGVGNRLQLVATDTITSYSAFRDVQAGDADYNSFVNGTVTNYYGFRADKPDASGGAITNDFGFWTNRDSGSGKWAFYGAGTAASYFGGTLNAATLQQAGIPLISMNDGYFSLSVKPAVTVVSVANQTLSGVPTIDGVALSGGVSVVLCTAQSTGSQNGPWVVQSGAWTRPTWYTSGSTTQAAQFITTYSRLGTLYSGTLWRMTTASVTIDTTSTTWVNSPFALNAQTVSGTLPNANLPAAISVTNLDGILGANTPAAATITTLSTSGDITTGADAGSTRRVLINSAAGAARAVRFETAGIARWDLNVSAAAESGSDAGSAFTVSAYTDAGALIDSPISFLRVSSGAMTFGGSTNRAATFNGTLTSTGGITSTTLGNTNTITLKDTLFTLQDDGDTTKQIRFELSGISTGTTRVLTLPNATTTLAGLAVTQTFTGLKTFSALLTATAGVTVSGAAASINDSSNFAVTIGTGTSNAGVNICGSSNTLGFFGITAVSRASAWTQTYTTTSATVANPTTATITDNSGGTSGGTTVASVAAAPVDTNAASLTSTRNAVATLVAMVNKLTADAAEDKKNLTLLIDQLQAYGLAQ